MSKAFSIDFETMSLRPNALLLSVGVVVFDPNKVQTYNELYSGSPTLELVFDQTHQVEKYGRHLCPDTAEWWDRQDSTARGKIFEAPMRYEFAHGMRILREWIAAFAECNDATDLWVKGAIADGVWFEDAMRAVGLKSPIHYRKIKCLRVRADDTGIPCPVVPQALPHNALSDALVQAMWVQRTQWKINQWRAYEGTLAKAA